MKIYSFDGEDLKMMLVGSVNLLAKSKAEIDALNVFPVPDGDTGTNMYLTLLAGVKEARQVEGAGIGGVAEAAARGCLYGARGNSGVILSQIIKGFADALSGQACAGAEDVARAFRMASDAAFQAVADPVEGTILTVCREIAAAFENLAQRYSDLVRITVHAYKQAQAALDRTPEQLLILKQSGVVDAGGQGLVTILHGIIRALKDAAAQQDIELFDLAASQQKEFVETRAKDYAAELKYTYCTEFIIVGNQIPMGILREELDPYGDCLLVVGDDSAAKVHIHSNHPGLVMECGLKYGALQNVKISNMEEQSQEMRSGPKKNDSEVGVVAVAMGEGLATILQSMGVDIVISGGQTMNPSSEDILEAVNDLPFTNIIVLPNNKNIIMAAEQAAKMADKPVAVIPTESIPQGIAALLSLNPMESLKENQERMHSSYCDVLTGEITSAVRDSMADGLEVKEGQFIGLADGRLAVCGSELAAVTGELIGLMAEEEGSLVTLFFGADVSSGKADGILEALEEQYPDIDFELYYGGQPLYHFLISVD
ncbi:MAG: DAK2 domain-containing protein [Firmicutes bacterium]|nr:DAK2 domain-containing protein [Bacillota bacterium]